LWSTPAGDTFSYDGAHYRLIDSPALPKPVQDPIPILIGGFGASRTPALAARFAHEFNLAFGTMEQWVQQRERVDAACAAIDRDPASVRRTVALTVICGRDEAEVARRADVIHRAPDELRQHQAAGTVAQVIERLLEYRDAGAETAYLQFLDLEDLDHFALVAEAVMPAIAD
jgi:alkanesulfonate monooxygenase